MVQEVDLSHESVSVLLDGELREDEATQVMAWLATDGQARAYWHACHVARDVLHDPRLAGAAVQDAAFMARLRGRLAHEVIAPPALMSAAVRTQPAPEAANDSGGWRQVAVVAVLALTAVLGWQLGLPQSNEMMVSAPPVQRIAVNPSQTMLRDPALDALVAAHRQQGGASAWLQPAGFLRGATLEPVSASSPR